MLSVLSLLLACDPSPPAPVPLPPTPIADVAADYDALLAELNARRDTLSASWLAASVAQRPTVLADARQVVLGAITEELMPAWHGTNWAFYGTAEYPHTGDVACGYYVSVVLRDAGFDVERAKLAQQASEHIIMTMSPTNAIWRYRGKSRREVADAVLAKGDGLYIVGLDYHVGFLVAEGDQLEMCHSDPNGGVRCEDAAAAAAFVSNYRVVGRVLTDETLQRWLQGEHFATVTR